MTEKKDWLNNFFEKNAWGILVAVIGLVTVFTILRTQVFANSKDIKDLEEAIMIMTTNQQDIIELQTNQGNIQEDVKEIKEDVKTLLQR